MVQTRSQSAAEKAAQAAEKATKASNKGLDGSVEDKTELEAVKVVVHEHSGALARLEESLARVQAEAKVDVEDLRQRLGDLMRAVASLQSKGTGTEIAARPTPNPNEGVANGGGVAGAAGGGSTAARPSPIPTESTIMGGGVTGGGSSSQRRRRRWRVRWRRRLREERRWTCNLPTWTARPSERVGFTLGFFDG
ncbi:unnamed protein product [Linum trigynum]|uniref:Uncharacterized protein n=1 Tax=Linum trigynum TaxID=586398 RepID=A0AAV2FFE9_9ROSI